MIFADGTDNFEPLTSCEWQLHVYGTAGPDRRAWADHHGWSLREFGWTVEARHAGLRRDAAYLVRPDGYLATVTPRKRMEVLQATMERWRLVPRRSVTAAER